jgi:hypothetical protein
MVTVLDKLTPDQKSQLKKGLVEVSGRQNIFTKTQNL